MSENKHVPSIFGAISLTSGRRFWHKSTYPHALNSGSTYSSASISAQNRRPLGLAIVFRNALALALVAIVIMCAPAAHAQSSDISGIIARMNAIIEEMNALQSEFKTLAASLQSNSASPTVLGAQTSVAGLSPVFTESLVFGETNDDIKKIQTLLATDTEIYDHPHVTGYFGVKTEEAIKNLQMRFGLDPVGVIGPATTALLEGYFRAYPNGNYPDGVLSTKPPAVLGASATSGGDSSTLAALQSQLSALQSGGSSSVGDNPADSVSVRFDDGEAWVTIEYNDGTPKMRIVADSEDEDDIVDFVVAKTKLTEAQVRALITYTNDPGDNSRSSSRSNDHDEDDAEDAIDEADEELDKAREKINNADEDGEDVDWADEAYDEGKALYRKAREAFKEEDWDEAVELAEEAEDLASEAIDRIGEEEGKGSDDIDEIIAYVGDDEAEIEVFYEDDDDSFTVKTEDEDEIVEEVADELGIDEDEVEDLIEFRGKKVDAIEVEIDDDESFADIDFEDGTSKTYSLSETDEDEIIERLAKKLDLAEDEIEDVIEFD